MACGSILRRLLAALGLALGLALLVAAFAPPAFAGEGKPVGLKIDVSGGYARLIFEVGDDIDSSARLAGNVLIISFSKPVTVDVDRFSTDAADFFAAARRDPDGKAIRLALTHKVKINSIPAGDKFFIDVLPDTWSEALPSLPQQVIDDLARRARQADRLAHLDQSATQQKKVAAVRVRVATQPTFTRFVFDLPDATTVSADRADERLTLTFGAQIKFDFADALAALPAAVAEIKSEVEDKSTLVRFALVSKVDVHTFRDGESYVVDIVPASDKDAAASPAAKNAALDLVPAGGGASEPAAGDRAAGKASPPPVVQDKPAAAAPAPAAAQVPVAPAIAAAPPARMAPETKPAAAAPATAAPQVPVAPAIPAAPPAQTAPEAKPAAAEPSAPAQGTAAPSAAPDSAAPPANPAATPSPPSHAGKTADTVAAELSRQGGNLKLSFAFLTPTALAVFQRADTLWIVFDAQTTIDLSALQGEASRTIRGAHFVRTSDADIVRIRLDRPHLSSVAADGPLWTVTIGDSVPEPTHALEMTRNMIGANHASVAIAFDEPHQMHRIADPDVGDQLLVVTAFAPIRGFIHAQDFVEFHALASTQGVAVASVADDLEVALAADKVVITRPGGLALSNSLQNVLRSSGLRPVMFDSQLWGLDRQSTFAERQSHLIATAAAAPAGKRLAPRLDLARFYIARDMFPEAKGVLDVALSQERPPAEDISATVLRAVTEIMMNRADDALKDLATAGIGNQHDAPLWRALAYARQGKWAQAREDFKSIEAAIATLPVELQRLALMDEMRAAIEVGDFGGASEQLNDFQTIGVPRELQPAVSVLIGRLSEGMKRSEDALNAYRTAADSWDRPAAAQARLRESLLRYGRGDLKREEVINELETLTTIWRGDETEIEALQVLARLYTEEGRYRDSFYVMRSAMAAHPNSDFTRRIQEEAAATFNTLFLTAKGDTLPAIDALALFYDFHDLVPIGRRGDEMIRRLADRLLAVDLLDQAAELLQYQVDHRLQGAARAQVATRLAVIYLLNHRADRALATLRATRTAEVSNELRNQRLLLEARALSDLGRHALGLEVIANLEGRESIRLRSDILWSARRWRESAEQIELYYGERWQEWQPLNEVERADLLRAAIGYALGEDALGLDRFREKYAAKMAQTPDARAFEIVSAPLGTGGADFRDIAHAAAASDTLDAFLRDLQAHYPEASVMPPPEKQSSPPAAAPATAPAPAKPKGPSSSPPGSSALNNRPKVSPQPAPPVRAAGAAARTAQR